MNADGPKRKGPKATDRAQEKGCVPRRRRQPFAGRREFLAKQRSCALLPAKSCLRAPSYLPFSKKYDHHK